MTKLHCGACQKEMSNAEILQKHLTTCPAAKALLIPAVHSVFGGDSTGHNIAHLIKCIASNTHLIEQYASAVACDLDSFYRAEIHKKLCSHLGLDYNKFRPFESTMITTMPSKEEAEKILWEALGEILRSHMAEKPL